MKIGSGARDQEIDKQDNKPLSPDGLVDILEDLYLLLLPNQTPRKPLEFWNSFEDSDTVRTLSKVVFLR
jgi:hypothetical protein